MATHNITVTDHELEVLKYILTTYETVITKVKYRKWNRDDALRDLDDMKLAVSNARQTLIFQDQN